MNSSPARRPTLSRSLFLSLALLATPLPLHAQGKLSDAAVRDQIRFARGLASDWGFVDLAEEVLERVETAGFSSELGVEFALVKCDVYADGAKNISDPVVRDELYGKAIEAYEAFIYENPYSEYKDAAEAALVEASTRLGRSLALKIEDAVGEEAEELSGRLQEVLTNAVSLTGDLIAGLKAEPDRTADQSRRLNELLYNRGSILLEIAKAQEDGAFNFDQSLKSYEDLAYSAGEGTPWGLRAYIGIGDNYAAQLLWDDSAAFYEFVVTEAWPRDPEFWEQLRREAEPTTDELQQRFLFVQFGVRGLIDGLRKGGDQAAAVDWSLFYYNLWKREGLELVKPMGDVAMLAAARALLEAGGFVGGSLNDGEGTWYATKQELEAKHGTARRMQRSAVDVALTVAQQVNQENRGNVLQIKAQKLISEIISRPGVVVAPDVLWEAAMGEYYDRNFQAAATSFRRVLSALDTADDAARVEYGAKVLYRLGRSLNFLDRDLEAAMVFQQALETWRGDPEYDALNADSFYKTLDAYKSRARGDQVIESLWRESESWVERVGQEGADDIAYRKAERTYDARDYEVALGEFQAVPVSATKYSFALVHVGICQYKLGDSPAASKSLLAYIDGFLKDPVNATTDPNRVAQRRVAEATANYFLGQIAFDAARAGEGGWEEVLRWLADFDERFPRQDTLAPAAAWRVLIAQLRLGDIEAVHGVYDSMIDLHPDSKWTGRASVDVYKVLEVERDAAEEAGDTARYLELTRELATFIEVGNRISDSPSYVNLRRESDDWMRLGEWAKAEPVLRVLFETFGEDPKEADSVSKYVLPDLGTALLRQQKVQDCVAFLKPLIDAKTANRDTARVYALALVGWADMVDENTVGEIPGVGSPEGFEEGNGILNQLAGAETKWEGPWYHAKFDWFYGYYKWGAIDGKKLETTRSELKKMRSQFEGDWSLVGDPVLQKKYEWLWSKMQ